MQVCPSLSAHHLPASRSYPAPVSQSLKPGHSSVLSVLLRLTTRQDLSLACGVTKGKACSGSAVALDGRRAVRQPRLWLQTLAHLLSEAKRTGFPAQGGAAAPLSSLKSRPHCHRWCQTADLVSGRFQRCG